jgi:hypothetical protein
MLSRKKHLNELVLFIFIIRFLVVVDRVRFSIPMEANCGSLLADLLLHEVRWTSFKGFSRIKIEN